MPIFLEANYSSDMMKNNRIYFIGIMLLAIVALNACSTPESKSISGKTIEANALTTNVKSVIGIEKGQLPPDFSVKTIEGATLTLSQLKEQKKPILLFFWATWCPSCAEDFAVVKNIYPKYADKVNYVAINLDTTEDIGMIKEYADKLGIGGIRFAEGNSKVLSDYKIVSTTTKYALNKEGVLLYKGSGAFSEKQWEILFNGMLGN